MRATWRLACALVPMVLGTLAAHAADVLAGPPTNISVTVYRAPARRGGSIDLDSLQGFALVSETRAVSLPAGQSRLRFEGVADGIEPASVIVAGMPSVVIEKDRDAQLLSPSALVAAAVGKKIVMVRTHAKSGTHETLSGTVESNADGVVFHSAQGVEALRCSGLSEEFVFQSTEGLTATPTLSVMVRSAQAASALVTVSYLARGFDWSADYSATLAPDGKTLSLGAWVTLANGNGTSFPSARTQVVAGKLNRQQGMVEPIQIGAPIIARCWPQGTTSDAPDPVYLVRAVPYGFDVQTVDVFAMAAPAPMPSMALSEVVLTGLKRSRETLQVSQEQLGDLKLYRVPESTTVASRQSKQVRLLDRPAVKAQIVYGADFDDEASGEWRPAQALLRTKNDSAHGLGLPLPSGRIAVFSKNGGTTVLETEAELRDLAVDEELEIDLGTRADLQFQATTESRSINPLNAKYLPLVPGVLTLRSTRVDAVRRVEIANAFPWPVQFEVRLHLADDQKVIRADHPLRMKNGRPLLEVTVPAGGRATVRYQTQETDG